MNLRYLALRLLIRLSDVIEIGICALRPDQLPYESITDFSNDNDFIKDERSITNEYLRDCFNLD